MIKPVMLLTIVSAIVGVGITYYTLSILLTKAKRLRFLIDEAIRKKPSPVQIVYVYDWHKTIALLIIATLAAYGFLFLHDLHLYVVTKTAITK